MIMAEYQLAAQNTLTSFVPTEITTTDQRNWHGLAEAVLLRVEQSTAETSTALSGLNKNHRNSLTKTLAITQIQTTCANIATAGNTLAQIVHDPRFYQQTSPPQKPKS